LDRVRSKLEFIGILTNLERHQICKSENRLLRDNCGDLSKIPGENDKFFFLLDTFYLNNLFKKVENEKAFPDYYI